MKYKTLLENKWVELQRNIFITEVHLQETTLWQIVRLNENVYYHYPLELSTS